MNLNETSRDFQIAHKKALKIADMLSITVVTPNDDGSKTIREPKPNTAGGVNINDIIEVILDEKP